MIDGLVAGKLHGKPEQRTSKNGKLFTTAKVRVAAGDGETLFVNIIAFEAGAQAALLALGDGDAVALAGTLTPRAWVDKTRAARPALDMVASQVLTAYLVRRKREAVAACGEQRQQQTQQPHQRQEPGDFGREDDAWLQGEQA